jgi:CDP-6-deoxy-D-xylo-4-hexulose-3-dehydrase
MKSNKFTQGPKVEEFESAWSNWLGAKHSLFVSSGSTANFLLVAAIIEKYGLRPGDKVLVPACTWVTNINPIIQLGLEPVFCDINLDNFSFCERSLKRIAAWQTIRMVFVTHLLGIPAPTKKIKELFPNAIIIDDVCESHGCTIDGVKVGAKSTGATFSFYFGHHMSTIEGGMISTNDEDLYDLMKMKRSHGMARTSSYYTEYAKKYPDIDPSFLFVSDGYNFRNTEIGAVLGLSQLTRLDKFIDIRRRRFVEFCVMMNNYVHLFHPIVMNPGNSSFCFPLIARDKAVKNRLTEKLREYKIEYRPVVSGNLLRQPYLRDRGYHVSQSTGNDAVDVLHDNGIYIGNNQFITSRDIQLLDKVLGEL